MKHVIDYCGQQIKKLLATDKYRVYSLIEFVQQSIIVILFAYLIAKLIDKINYEIFGQNEEEELVNPPVWLLGIELIVFIIIFFYVSKLISIIPSIPFIFDSTFTPNKSLDTIMSLIFIIITTHFSKTFTDLTK